MSRSAAGFLIARFALRALGYTDGLAPAVTDELAPIAEEAMRVYTARRPDLARPSPEGK